MNNNTNARNYLVTTAVVVFLIFGMFSLNCREKTAKNSAQEYTESLIKQSKENTGYDFIARYLAGKADSETSPGAENAKKWLGTKEYAGHKKFLEKVWPESVAPELSTLSDWVAKEIPEAAKYEGTVFYPFSGPDFLYVSTIYPMAGEYYMFGLEPPGSAESVQEILNHKQSDLFHSVQIAINDIVNFSFFRTIDMAKDLKKNVLQGTAPIMLVFMANLGYTVINVEDVYIGSDGQLKTGEIPAGAVKGIRIDAVHPTDHSKVRKVYYFSIDISDQAMAKDRRFLKFMQDKSCYSYAKAASYLMHKDYFSKIRNTMLDQSNFIIEDDSGIPYRFFNKDIWDISLYGNYNVPIELFQNWYQKDLHKVYQTKGVAKHLPLGIGYKYQEGSSNLLVARKKMPK